MKWKREIARCLPVVLALLCGSGCVTKHLWDSNDLEAWNQPAANPNLHVFQADPPHDSLIVYDQYSERSDATHTRSYWLNENQKVIESGRMPHFVSTNSAAHLTSVPVLLATGDQTNLPSPPFAVVETNGQSFTLHLEDGRISTHHLPFYNDGKGKVEKFVLTPLATTADLTIIGGVIGYWWLYGMESGGASYSFAAPRL